MPQGVTTILKRAFITVTKRAIMTKITVRIIGVVIIIFNLWLIGNYNITGIPVILMTVGVALFFELIIIKKLN